jgi:gluconokinase
MIILVMGVMGAGKTALGRALARGLGARFFDADDAHSPENRDRLARGEPLTDEQREPWLREVAGVLAEPQRRKHMVVACPALRRRHREQLRRACPELRLVFLQPSSATLRERLALRRGHFASPALLESQLDTLEPPDAGEGAIFVDNEESVETVAARLLSALVLDLDDPAAVGSTN